MRISILITALSIMFSSAFAVLEIPNAQPKVHASEWKWVLDSTWAGLKRRNIDSCRSKEIYKQNPDSPGGLICRPKSETPWDAVSEGIGYGMLLALYADDQPTFDKIYNAGKEFGLNFCQGWRKPSDGGGTEPGSATDADEDIALALIFAAKLVEKNRWNSSSINYANDAQAGINCVYDSFRGDGGLNPGNQWDPGYNIGYFAPAWYRIFRDFDSQKRNDGWDRAISKSYALIEANPAYDIGMVPDWTNHNGNFLDNGPGYNAYLNGQAFFKDAIRVLWRIANDYIWFKEPRAKKFLENSLEFIYSKGGPEAANFYQLKDSNKGELVPASDKWTDFNNDKDSETWRWRREHSHLTVGQWLTAVMAVGTDDEKIAWSKKMAEFYDYDIKDIKQPDYFGLAVDPTGGIEDTLHNEIYFDQFLAWFGVSLMSGTWVNVVELLDKEPIDNVEGIPGSPFPEPPNPIIAKSNIPPGIQINQSYGILRLSSQSDVVWKIHNLQGKLLFTSNSKEATWNAGFKGMVVVSAIKGSSVERKLLSTSH
ncbi:MAG: hypothetical protein LBB36_00940 [Fibromonadaceae bacterium]|nr:hypothetical protein [Fibromonadaceae bacterium]